MNANEIIDGIKITGLTADSRQVKSGFLFAAIPGTQVDGAQFIPAAIKAGATAILAPKKITQSMVGSDVTLITDENPRRRLAKMAAAFYQPQPDTITAITGTNGKTSVASFTRQLWQALKKPSASIGTLGIVSPENEGESGLTTPDPVDLHRALGELKQQGIDHVAMEASSHGLDMYRMDGVRFIAAAFTNLSRDHLDYHGSMDIYRAAKMRLFEELLVPGGTMVINSACSEYDRLANIAVERKQRVLAYGINNGQIRCIKHQAVNNGFNLTLDVMGDHFDVDFPLLGQFQIENALCALGLVIACGASAAHVVPLLGSLTPVRGRMEFAASHSNGAAIYVDFAHTPDALETVLKSIRPHVKNKLHVVFGCGGDRDPGKRQLMGKAAQSYADQCIVTDDNPRSEDPAKIRTEIMTGCKGAIEISSRGEAIEQACLALKEGDILIVAGKGHERGQIIGNKTLPFDDVKVVRDIISKIGGQI